MFTTFQCFRPSSIVNHLNSLIGPISDNVQAIPSSRGFSLRGFATHGIFKGSVSIVSMDSMEPIKFAQWGLNPSIIIKRRILCIWVHHDGSKCKLSNSMVLQDLWNPYFSSHGFHFPRMFLSPKHPGEERTSCILHVRKVHPHEL